MKKSILLILALSIIALSKVDPTTISASHYWKPYKYRSDSVALHCGPETYDNSWSMFTSMVDNKAIDGKYYGYYMGQGSGLFRICLATSYDGIKWTKYASNPILPLGAAGTWEDSTNSYPLVWKEGATDWRMLYQASGSGAGTHLRKCNIGYATSADGITWSKSGSNPVFSCSNAGPGNSWDSLIIGPGHSMIKESGTYYLFYSGYGSVSDQLQYRIGLATSTNLTTWTRANSGNAVLVGSDTTTLTNRDNCAFEPCVIKYGSTYWMWYQGNKMRTTPGLWDSSFIFSAYSTDKINWTKVDSATPIIPIGPYKWRECPLVVDMVSEWRCYYMVYTPSVDGSTHNITFASYVDSTWSNSHSYGADKSRYRLHVQAKANSITANINQFSYGILPDSFPTTYGAFLRANDMRVYDYKKQACSTYVRSYSNILQWCDSGKTAARDFYIEAGSGNWEHKVSPSTYTNTGAIFAMHWEDSILGATTIYDDACDLHNAGIGGYNAAKIYSRVTGAPGLVGAALYLKNKGETTAGPYAFMTDADDLSFSSGGGVDLPFTFITWDNIDSLSGFEIAKLHNGGNGGTEYLFMLSFNQFGINKTFQPALYTDASTPNRIYNRNSKQDTINKWKFLATTYSGSKLYGGLVGYKNGVSFFDEGAAQGTYTGMVASADTLFIGLNKQTLRYGRGKIANTRLYNRAMPAEEILAYYNYENAPMTQYTVKQMPFVLSMSSGAITGTGFSTAPNVKSGTVTQRMIDSTDTTITLWGTTIGAGYTKLLTITNSNTEADTQTSAIGVDWPSDSDLTVASGKILIGTSTTDTVRCIDAVFNNDSTIIDAPLIVSGAFSCAGATVFSFGASGKIIIDTCLAATLNGNSVRIYYPTIAPISYAAAPWTDTIGKTSTHAITVGGCSLGKDSVVAITALPSGYTINKTSGLITWSGTGTAQASASYIIRAYGNAKTDSGSVTIGIEIYKIPSRRRSSMGTFDYGLGLSL